ncbi:fasciclin domain-containing protein [Haloferula sargassicola]|uniref:FAS1 domain-containing protein n=1 Tax=Haloferula sargassicola TaxID=490096 RepID=A0ABP9UP36_9BACT
MKLTEFALMLAIPVAGPAALADEKTDMDHTTDSPAMVVDPALPQNVYKAIKDGATFQLLEEAIDAAGLEENLTNAGAITVFAPTDEAFRKLPSETMAQLLAPENKLKLRELLLSHVIAGRMMSSSMQDGEMKTMSGDKIEIDVDGKEVKFGDAKVVNADIDAGNGVIQVIDKVVVPEALDGFAGLDED